MSGIFLVYAQADQDAARQVGQMLGAVSLWTLNNLPSSANSWVEGARESDGLLVIVSPASNDDPQVKEVVDLALGEGLPIISVVTGDANLVDKLGLGDTRIVMFGEGVEEKLGDAVEELTGKKLKQRHVRDESEVEEESELAPPKPEVVPTAAAPRPETPAAVPPPDGAPPPQEKKKVTPLESIKETLDEVNEIRDDLGEKLVGWVEDMPNQGLAGVIGAVLKIALWLVWLVAWLIAAVFVTPFALMESWAGILILLSLCCICSFFWLVFS